MGDTTDELDVLIIGAGFAGISAARSLAPRKLRLRVIDSFPEHLGGRSFSFASPEPSGTKLRFDHGAQYVGDLQNTLMTQIQELIGADQLVNGAALRKPYPYEVMVLGGERMVFKSSQTLFGIPGVPPQLGVLGALQMLALLAEMTIIEWCIDIVEPWRGPEALLDLDQVTVWDWVKSKAWVSSTVADLVRISVEALLSVEPTEISPYYLLWYTACNDGFLNEINDNEGGPQQYWLLRGTDEIAQRMADPIADHVERGVSATAIDLSGDLVQVTLNDGRVVETKKVLLAVSPATAGRRVSFTPELPDARKQLLSQPMGRTLKCQIFYRSDWWHAAEGGYAYDGYVGGAHYPVLWVMDNSPPGAKDDGGPYVLMTFTVGDELDALGANPSQEAIESFVTGALRDLFDDERALSTSPEFIRLESYIWDPSEAEVGGGPNTVFTPGKLTGDAGRVLNEPWDDKVFFASAENSMNPHPQSKHVRWDAFAEENLPKYDQAAVRLPEPKAPYFSKYSDRRKSLGYMDGAIHSGRYAAERIAQSLGLAHDLPEPAPSQEPRTPPPAAGHAPAAALALLSDLRRALDGLTSTELEAYAARELAAGRGPHASWIRDELLQMLRAHGHVAEDAHPIEALAALRDFVVGLVSATSKAHNLGGEVMEHVEAMTREIEAANKKIAELFAD